MIRYVHLGVVQWTWMEVVMIHIWATDKMSYVKGNILKQKSFERKIGFGRGGYFLLPDDLKVEKPLKMF